MMKHLKKIMALAIALVMCMSMGALTAFAAGTDSITIGNSTKNSTYDAYKVFDVTYASTDTTNDDPTVTNEAFSYTISSSNPFFNTIKGYSNLKDAGSTNTEYFELEQIGSTGVYNVKGTSALTGGAADSTPTSAQGTAGSVIAPALKAVVDGMTDAEKTAAKAGSATATADNQSGLQITGLEHGYYFVTTTTGSLCSLDTTQPTVTINDKNEKPTVDKEVKEGDTWGETSDGEIGDTVEFRTTIHAKAGAVNYVLHDKMDAGLTFSGTVTITPPTGKTIATTDYLLLTKDAASGTLNGKTYNKDSNCTFEIVFSDTWMASNITAASDIVVTYTATINSNAVVAGDGNENDTHLTYGNNNDTSHDKTKTYTWEVDVYKYANGTESTPLAGATFKIVNSAKTKAATITNGKLSGWVDLANGDNADNGIVTVGTDLTTTTTGKLEYTGFDEGTYYLVETAAPAGYNKLKEPVTITITSTESGETNAKTLTATVTNAAKLAAEASNANAKNYVKVNNNSGAELPSTGGIGTTIFYILGSVLVIGGGILLISRRRLQK